MIVTLDSNCLVRWATQDDTNEGFQRLDHLFSKLSSSRGRLIIPAPAFAEFLVGANEASAAWLEGMTRKAAVRVVPLDTRAAFECALLDRAALASGDKRHGRQDSWQRIKIDRQVIAIARVSNSDLIVSTDRGLRTSAASVGMRAVHFDELELPAKQHGLPFESKATAPRPAPASPPPAAPPLAAGPFEPEGNW